MSLRRLALRLAHAAVDTTTILDNLVWSRRELTRCRGSQRTHEPQVRPWPAVVGIGENGLAGLDPVGQIGRPLVFRRIMKAL